MGREIRDEKRKVLRKPSPAPSAATNPSETPSASGQEHGTWQSSGPPPWRSLPLPLLSDPSYSLDKRLHRAAPRRVPFTVPGAAHPVQTMPCPGTFTEPCPGPRSPAGLPRSAPLRSLPRKVPSLLRCAPRRLCPPLLLVLLVLLVLVTEASLGTAASALHRRDKLDLSEAGRGEEEFYLIQNSNIYCRKCAAGTYVEEYCKEQNGFSKCLPCKDNEYIEYPNDLPICFGCRTCREDEVELSPCRAVQDTQCACRNGTFCSPEHPCEMCQKCRPRCPKGEVELAPCTPYSDRRCGPPTTTFHSLPTRWIVIISVTVTVVVVVLLCFGIYCCCRSTGDRTDLSGKPCSVMDYLLQRLIRFRSRSLGTQDNKFNDSFSQNPLLSKTLEGGSPSAPGPEVMVPGTVQPTVKPRKKLVPVEGAEPYARLRSSFYTFAQKVPHDLWKRFGRALNLLENDIALAEKEVGLEVLIEMLKKWQEKETIGASVNTLLDTLHQINLGGVAEDISIELVKEGSFQYEVS